MEIKESCLCKNCGAGLDIASAENGVVRCAYCGGTFTVARKEASPAALSFLRMGEHCLDTCKFDDAYSAYFKAAELDGGEPEAYFGMALAEFGVQYIKDGVNNCLQPICHTVSSDKFEENKNYIKARSLATREQQAQYLRLAQDIDYIREEFFKLKNSGLDYDCFICVKVTDDETKLRTSDYKDADDIYFELKGKGFKPFFSERELRNVTGADYEARILYALYSSECMIVVCNDESYLQTPWVKNEYTRFLQLINDEEKERDSITIAFNGKPIEKLAGRSGKIQGINLASRTAFEAVVNFVEQHSPEAKKRRDEELRLKEEEEKRKSEEAAEQRKRLEEIERKLNAVPAQSPEYKPSSVSAQSLITRGEQELAACEYALADKYFSQALELEPKNPDVWWGKFLAEFHAKNIDLLLANVNDETLRKIGSSKNYRNAMFYGGDNKKYNAVNLKFRSENDSLKRNLDDLSAKLASARGDLEQSNVDLGREKEILKKTSEPMPAMSVGMIFGFLFAIGWLIFLIVYAAMGKIEGASSWINWNGALVVHNAPNCIGGLGGVVLYVIQPIVYGIIVTIAFSLIFWLLFLPSSKKRKAAQKKYDEQKRKIAKLEKSAADYKADVEELEKSIAAVEEKLKIYGGLFRY